MENLTVLVIPDVLRNMHTESKFSKVWGSASTRRGFIISNENSLERSFLTQTPS